MMEAVHRIGRYELLGALGQGAMGVVYKARDPQLDRIVAIKTLRRDLGLPAEEYAHLRKRFYQEAKAAGRLSHPNIVTIHDVVEIGDVPYIVMEFLEGRTLADLIAAEGRLGPDRAVNLIVQVCRALEYAHAHDVVHRDIKPGNILVTAEGVAKVSDFGIARITGSDVTRTGVLVGTPAYMSPEQLEGRVPDGRSDLFALGVVLYEGLTGTNPFLCDELAAILYRIVQVDPPPVREWSPGVPPALEQVAARALAKEPGQRYPSARAFAQALTDALEGRAGGAGRAEPLPPSRRARAIQQAVAIGIGGLVVAGAGGWSLWSRGSAPPPAIARRAADQGGESLQRPGEAAPRSAPANGPSGDATAVIREADQGADPHGPQETVPQPAAAGKEPGVQTAPSPEPGPGRPGARRALVLGSIAVNTNPAAEVFVDGVPRGQTGNAPLVIRDVAVGERRVTLRLGTRERTLHGTVQEGQTLRLTYHFPEDPGDVPLDKVFEATRDKILDTAREKLREADKLRETIEKKARDAARGKPPWAQGDAR